MEDRKKKADRKKEQEIIQKGWKDLMESVEKWEELQEGELDFDSENLDDWFNEEWTEEGFQEAGKVLETILTEVIAFIELSGTVQTNNQSPGGPCHQYGEGAPLKQINTK